MRYAQMRKMDVSNGRGVGVSLFVQGCPIHCKNCFNKETWDFNGGMEWTPQTEKQFLDLINRDYISRVSILGGEPLCDANYMTVRCILKQVPEDKEIWVYTGYTWESLTMEQFKTAIHADYLVDGSFVDTLKDMRLEFRGSSNQRIIDVKQTLKTGGVVLFQ